MKIDRKQILEAFLENISRMTDKDYQERVWVRVEGPECDDIDETIAYFFEEDALIDNYQDFDINETQLTALRVLHKNLRTFTDTYGIYSPFKSTKKLINMPEWEKIMEMAKEVLEEFHYKK